jgi:hypothetical protein
MIINLNVFSTSIKTGLADKYLAPILSHQSFAARGEEIPSSYNRVWIHIISAVTLATALYSALLLDLETISCFRALQDTRFDPKNIAKPPVDLLSSRQPVQSASKNLLTKREFDLHIFNPILIVFQIPQNSFNSCPMIHGWTM